MKKIIFAFLFCAIFTQAQTPKSLLWEISGKNLSKKSYVYGTMHVSEKLSYHLSDAFFKSILSCDYVANESNPETWYDAEKSIVEPNNENTGKFYTNFYLKPYEKNDLLNLFQANNNFFTNILSKLEGENTDYQENVVLDMFIFQTGKKYKKNVIGLEDITKTIKSLNELNVENVRPKDENIQVLLKMLKGKNYFEALKDYYREKDIQMLDSIYKLATSKKSHEIIITNRNKIMVKSMDSIMQHGSLFSAVGAAHLAGKDGIIHLLREKGYTVKPVIDVLSEKGKVQKKTIEELFPNPNFQLKSTTDAMVQMPMNATTHETDTTIGSPDYTNGGIITIKRMPINYFLDKSKTTFNPKTLDSLFYEYIPGEILENKFSEKNLIKSFDIKNLSKTGNRQHYKFYITPLEIISVAMTGIKNYVALYENDVFDKIKIKEINTNWEFFTPKKGGFTVEIPSFYSTYGNDNLSKRASEINILAFEPEENGYYFLEEKTLNDLAFLEDEAYEHKQIQYEFYNQNDAEIENFVFDTQNKTATSSSKIGNKNIKLKTVIDGSKYYLLGAVNTSQKNTDRFFNSFKPEKFNYDSEIQVFNDTLVGIKVDVPKKMNQHLFINKENALKSEKNQFKDVSKFKTITANSGKQIQYISLKYPKYESYTTLDSLKAHYQKYFLNDEQNSDTNSNYYDDYEQQNTISLISGGLNKKKGFSKSTWDSKLEKTEPYEIVSQNFTHNKENDSYTFDYLVAKPNSQQAQKSRLLFNGNSYVLLSTLVNKNYKNDDQFIENTFNSIAVTQPKKPDLFKNKWHYFLEDINSEKDTIHFSAINSVEDLTLQESDLEEIKQFLETYQFKDNEVSASGTLIEKIGALQHKSVIPFLEKLYYNKNIKTNQQLSILQALALQNSEAGYQKIYQLMENDLPLPEEKYMLNYLFAIFSKNLENSKILYPRIFEYFSVPEYNIPVISFCNQLLENKMVAINDLKSFKKMILTNAKLEMKRVLSSKQNSSQNADDDYVSEVLPNSENTENLIAYLNLLSYFSKDTEIEDVFKKAENLAIPDITVELLRLKTVNNTISQEEIDNALKNIDLRFVAIQLLLNHDTNKKIDFTDQEIAEAALHNFEKINSNRDTITFLKQEKWNENNIETQYFFYKIETKDSEGEIIDRNLHTIAFINTPAGIDAMAFQYSKDAVNNDDEEINRKCKANIKKLREEQHIRANFDKISDLLLETTY